MDELVTDLIKEGKTNLFFFFLREMSHDTREVS